MRWIVFASAVFLSAASWTIAQPIPPAQPAPKAAAPAQAPPGSMNCQILTLMCQSSMLVAARMRRADVESAIAMLANRDAGVASHHPA